MSRDFIKKWNEIKSYIAELDLEIHKNASGKSYISGIRSRSGLRVLIKMVKEFIKMSLEFNKVFDKNKPRRTKKDEK